MDMQRKWVVMWLYIVASGHFVGALALTWGADTAILAAYHQQILASFGFTPDSSAIALQHWWMSLFGATLQAFSLFLIGLIYVGNRYRSPEIWLGLVLVILLWAPQDIIISLQQNAWTHVGVDVFALIILTIPLLWLWNQDRKLRKGE